MVRKYLAEIGRRGGLKSRRKLDPNSAKEMVKVREARKAYKKFYAECFWSFDPQLKIRPEDIQWVANTLMKNGGRKAWDVGAKL